MISTAEINKQVFQTKKEIGLELRCRREKKGLSLAEAGRSGLGLRLISQPDYADRERLCVFVPAYFYAGGDVWG